MDNGQAPRGRNSTYSFIPIFGNFTRVCHSLKICTLFGYNPQIPNPQNQLFLKILRDSNSLDPDRARHLVGPDLGPNCLQGFQQTTNKQAVHELLGHLFVPCADPVIFVRGGQGQSDKSSDVFFRPKLTRGIWKVLSMVFSVENITFYLLKSVQNINNSS